VPYIKGIVEKSDLTKERFEGLFNEKYRDRRRTMEDYWRKVIEDKLLPLKEERANFAGEVEYIYPKPSRNNE
jgi:type I restriction enzyme R subunit